MRAVFIILPLTILSFVVVATGCGTPSIEGDPPLVLGSKRNTKKERAETDPNDPPPEGDGEPVPPEPPPGSSNPDAGTTPPPPAACTATATSDACFTCCEEQHPQGIPFLQQAFGNCVCGTGAGNCSAECGASFCAGAAPSALCEQCLDAADTCRVQSDTACEQNPACNAMFQCDTASQCASKPS